MYRKMTVYIISPNLHPTRHNIAVIFTCDSHEDKTQSEKVRFASMNNRFASNTSIDIWQSRDLSWKMQLP